MSHPASDEDLEFNRELLSETGLPSADIEGHLVAMTEGATYRTVNNRQYLHRHPDPGVGSFANGGKPGYEAQGRQLQQIWRAQLEPSDADTDSGADEPGRTGAKALRTRLLTEGANCGHVSIAPRCESLHLRRLAG